MTAVMSTVMTTAIAVVTATVVMLRNGVVMGVCCDIAITVVTAEAETFTEVVAAGASQDEQNEANYDGDEKVGATRSLRLRLVGVVRIALTEGGRKEGYQGR